MKEIVNYVSRIQAMFDGGHGQLCDFDAMFNIGRFEITFLDLFNVCVCVCVCVCLTMYNITTSPFPLVLQREDVPF